MRTEKPEFRTLPSSYLVVLLACLSFFSLAAAAGQNSEPRKLEFASVSLDGRDLFSVVGVAAYPAKQRATEISGRLKAAAEDKRLQIEQLRIEESATESAIFISNQHLVSVIDSDAESEGVDRATLAKAFSHSIGIAITSYRSERSTDYLQKNALLAGGILLLTGLVLWSIFKTRQWFVDLIRTRHRAALQKLGSASYGVIGAEQFAVALQSLANALAGLLTAATALSAALALMELFPWTRGIAHWIEALFLAPLEKIGTAIATSIPDLVFLSILFLVTKYLLRLMHLFFLGVARGTIALPNFYPDWAVPTFKILRIAFIAFAVVIAYPYIPGSESEAFKGISLFMGVLFSIGSNTMIANTLAGYNLIYRRIYQVGDYVRIGPHVGVISELGQSVTRLHTFKNEEVVLPNSMVLASEVLNFTNSAREGDLVLHTTVTIGYDVPWRQVEAMLLEGAARAGRTSKERSPFVLKKSLSDFYIEYELNVYCDDPAGMPRLNSEIHAHIVDVFNEYGVQIMSPHFVAQPDSNITVPKDRWFDAPASASNKPKE